MNFILRALPLICLPLLLTACSSSNHSGPRGTGDRRAVELADKVIDASGGDAWRKVSRIQFTFNVEQDGRIVASRKHDWDVKEGTDTVTVNNHSTTVGTRQAPPDTDAAAKQAYQQWVNDSYWLLAPLKLRDPGVILAYNGRQTIGGKTYEVIQSRYDNVGLTSNDSYNFYIDPKTFLVQRWDYMPSPDRTTSGTWEDYRDFDGLMLSTNHRFGPRRIFFTDIEVIR